MDRNRKGKRVHHRICIGAIVDPIMYILLIITIPFSQYDRPTTGNDPCQITARIRRKTSAKRKGLRFVAGREFIESFQLDSKSNAEVDGAKLITLFLSFVLFHSKHIGEPQPKMLVKSDHESHLQITN